MPYPLILKNNNIVTCIFKRLNMFLLITYIYCFTNVFFSIMWRWKVFTNAFIYPLISLTELAFVSNSRSNSWTCPVAKGMWNPMTSKVRWQFKFHELTGLKDNGLKKRLVELLCGYLLQRYTTFAFFNKKYSNIVNQITLEAFRLLKKWSGLISLQLS